MLPSVADIAVFLASRLPGTAEDNGTPLLWRVADPSHRVRRIGVALDERALLNLDDDLWILHRPFRVGPVDDIPILAVHAAFDAHLALGYNPTLAKELGLRNDLEELWRSRPGMADERIAMIGTLTAPLDGNTLQAKLEEIFFGLETAQGLSTFVIERIAVAGAMTNELVEQAYQRGARAYVTGQFREPARKAVERTGMAVAVVGHRRSELWGLRRLAQELTAQFPDTTVIVREEDKRTGVDGRENPSRHSRK